MSSGPEKPIRSHPASSSRIPGVRAGLFGELGWLVGAPWRLLTGWPRLVVAVAGVVFVLVGVGQAVLLLLPAVGIAGLAFWYRVAPRSFEAAAGGPFRRTRLAWRVRRRWP